MFLRSVPVATARTERSNRGGIMGRRTIVVSISLVLLAAAGTAEAATSTDSACGLTALGVSGNCGDLTVTVDVNEGTCARADVYNYTCKVDVTASATATGWLNSGSLTLQIAGCAGSTSASWPPLAGTTAPAVRSCSPTASFRRGQSTQVSYKATVTYSGTLRPRNLSATASDSYTAPVPTGPRVIVYSDIYYSGEANAYNTSVSDFWTTRIGRARA